MMRLRILCTVCCVCVYVKLCRSAFYKTSYLYARMVIHGLLYLEGQVICKRLCECWAQDVRHQRLVHFLNHGHMDINGLNTRRVEHLLLFVFRHAVNREDLLQEYLLLSIDASDFKKYKNKRMQGVHYMRDAKGGSNDWQDSLSEIRNGLIRDFEKDIALKYHLTLPKHAQKTA